MDVVFFRDVNDEEIKMAGDVWENHIKVDHPEMTVEIIGNVLKTPSVVCSSQHENMKNYKLYYQGPWKNKMEKKRYFPVVVKICNDGNWISTAHTRSSVSCGIILFQEGK